jgi:acetate kinase
VLALNAGSTSLKVSLVAPDLSTVVYSDLEEALAASAPDAVVHRVVHGGDRTQAVVVDDAVTDELGALTELAPLHQPPALATLARARAALPDVPHVACFDTAFHRTISRATATYALPQRFRDTLHVYGFHGLSHAWAAGQVAERVPGARRVLVAHLGGGASLCAVRDGRSVDTTMGFTPLDGLVMGTRSGHVDPGALVWLVKHSGEDLEDLLERRSGLQALAGTSDLREVERRRAEGDTDAGLAFDVYLHSLVSHTGAMVAAMGGLDVLVLTGGVGEHSTAVREELCARLAWLGVNAQDDGGSLDPLRDLTVPGARVRTLVVRSREDLEMVRQARTALAGPAG